MCRLTAPVDPRRLRTHGSKGRTRLKRQDAVAERRDLLVLPQLVSVGDPSGRQAHEPFDERWCWAGSVGVVQERRGGRGASGDVFPAGDGVGVASPALNSPSIRDHSVSDSALLVGEPAGPWSAKSMIWCESAIVPRLALTWSSVSPPRVESVASGVLNSALAAGKDEDAEPGVGSADEGCW